MLLIKFLKILNQEAFVVCIQHFNLLKFFFSFNRPTWGFEIRGFGSFALNYRPPRLGRNPKSGDKVQVPSKYVPHFKAGKELRERVDYPQP